jgi:predicted nucleic acid-binding protein
MIVYAETSAVLRWLLGGPEAERVAECLAKAERVASSRLTLGETRRVLSRAVVDGSLPARTAGRARNELEAEAVHWDIMEIPEPVWNRAEERFPLEPVRMLDALHLATALRFQTIVGDVAMLSTDDRVLGNWRALHLPEALGQPTRRSAR